MINILMWALIAISVIVTAAWMVWAGHQPETHSSWAPD
jgi:hypothetical protein